MTKEEILATISNHKGDIAVALNNVQAIISSLVSGKVPDGDAQKEMALSTINLTDFAEVKLAEIVDAIKQWPE